MQKAATIGEENTKGKIKKPIYSKKQGKSDNESKGRSTSAISIAYLTKWWKKTL